MKPRGLRRSRRRPTCRRGTESSRPRDPHRGSGSGRAARGRRSARSRSRNRGERASSGTAAARATGRRTAAGPRHQQPEDPRMEQRRRASPNRTSGSSGASTFRTHARLTTKTTTPASADSTASIRIDAKHDSGRVRRRSAARARRPERPASRRRRARTSQASRPSPPAAPASTRRTLRARRGYGSSRRRRRGSTRPQSGARARTTGVAGQRATVPRRPIRPHGVGAESDNDETGSELQPQLQPAVILEEREGVAVPSPRCSCPHDSPRVPRTACARQSSKTTTARTPVAPSDGSAS